MFCSTLLYAHSSIAIILMGKRELVTLLSLSSWCLVMAELLVHAVPWGCLRFVIVVFPDHTHYFCTSTSLGGGNKLLDFGDLNLFSRSQWYFEMSKLRFVIVVFPDHTHYFCTSTSLGGGNKLLDFGDLNLFSRSQWYFEMSKIRFLCVSYWASRQGSHRN